MGEDPGAEFARLMSGAAAAASPPTEAPYGYTTDRATGERRPKLAPGRPRRPPPSVEELKAAREGEPGPDGIGPQSPPAGDLPPDRAPDEKARRHAGASPAGEPKAEWVPGRIARGMDRLYRRAGKLIKAFDPAIGQAVIEATRKEDPEDVTVGEAWEEVARTNPRIRRFLLRLISGGAWGQLAMAHLPILLAVLLKPAILSRLPFARLIEAMADDEDQAPAPDGENPGEGLFDGMSPVDMGQLLGVAQGLAANFRSRAVPTPPVAGAADRYPLPQTKAA